MTTTVDNSYLSTSAADRRWHFDWLLPTLTQPRQTMARVVAVDRGIARTPLLILLLTSLVLVLVTGSIKQTAAASGQISLPPGFEYYTPEQQAAFQQAMTATSGPVFIYVLPALLSVVGVFAAWLAVGWLLHLLLTMMGGRGPSYQTLNLVAWASVPFALRHLVRIGAMLSSNQLLSYPGLSGFAPLGEGNLHIYLAALLALVDMYLVWQLALLVAGIRATDSLPVLKAWVAPLFAVVLLLLLRALPALIGAQFGDVTMIRPFF